MLREENQSVATSSYGKSLGKNNRFMIPKSEVTARVKPFYQAVISKPFPCGVRRTTHSAPSETSADLPSGLFACAAGSACKKNVKRPPSDPTPTLTAAPTPSAAAQADVHQQGRDRLGELAISSCARKWKRIDIQVPGVQNILDCGS